METIFLVGIKKMHNLPSLISGTNGNQNFCQLEGKLGGIEKVAAKHSLRGSTESQLLHYNFIFGDFKGKSRFLYSFGISRRQE